jgi:hypothetical protein
MIMDLTPEIRIPLALIILGITFLTLWIGYEIQVAPLLEDEELCNEKGK